MRLVGRQSVPNEESAVLRGRNEVDRIAGPMHGVDFCEVSFERTTRTRCGGSVELFVDTVEVFFQRDVIFRVCVFFDLCLQLIDLFFYLSEVSLLFSLICAFS